MNDTTNTLGAEVAAEVAPFNLNRTVTYNFKKVKEADMLATLSDEQKSDEKFIAQFERITEGEGDKARVFLKRKSFNATITLPDSIADIPVADRETIAAIVERELQQFAKTQYVDSYLPIGDHDLATYRSVVATRGSKAAWDYTPEQLVAACGSLESYISKAVGNGTVGKKFADAAKQRFSRSAIQRYLGNFEESLLNKINVRLAGWGQHLVDNSPADAEEFGVIYEMLTDAIDKHLKAEIVDVSSFL